MASERETPPPRRRRHGEIHRGRKVIGFDHVGPGCLQRVDHQLHTGRVVMERYWSGMTPNTLHAVFSVTKSMTSTLVGIAQDDGDLNIDDSASKLCA